MTTAARPALRLLGAPALPQERDDLGDEGYLTVPVPRTSGAGRGLPWQGDDDVAWVPAVLLLAASGRCSCDDCCQALARRQRRSALASV